MSNFSKTLSDSLRLFGGAPTDKWNAYNWNAFIWGEGTNTMIKTPGIHLPTDSISFSENLRLAPAFHISDSISCSDSIKGLSLQDGNGYYYLFIPNQTNAQSANISIYSALNISITSWVTAVGNATVWN